MNKIIKVISLFVLTTQMAHAACQTGYFPTSEESTTRKYIFCDTQAEIPVSGYNSGDLVYAVDEGQFIVAVNSTDYMIAGLKPFADDMVRLSSSDLISNWTSVPDCDLAASAITYDTATNSFGCNSIVGGAGESNTASNSGTGNRIVLTKAGVDIPFRTFVSGDNVTIATNATDLTFNVPSVPSSDVVGVIGSNNGGTGVTTLASACVQITGSTELCDGDDEAGSGSSPLTTKGDLYTFTTLDSRLGIGADGTFLSADSGQATGLVWRETRQWTKYLAADKAISSVTAEEVQGLESPSLVAGTYAFKYYIRCTSATASVGLKFGVNYTGTATTINVVRYYFSTGTSATNGIMDDTALVLTGSLAEVNINTSESTTTATLGPNTGVFAINSSHLNIIEGIITVSDTGTLELWHGSETATSTTVQAGSVLILNRIN